MIAILNYFINISALHIGFVLGDMIHILLNPLGAVMAVSLLAYLKYATIKNISKNMRGFIAGLRRYELKKVSPATVRSATPAVALKRHYIGILNMLSKSIPVVATRTLFHNFSDNLNKKRITRRITAINKRIL